ncbi:energy-coupling factor transporter transmembrane protein EcfT [Pedobacter cryoconitis]|uniref:Energy-coupling factor transporter transmembrane protein EcfT n=1 Tax=Pedobacter cryoconitis TaxID=188932 RepID=A0A7W8ZHW6_9SPHI|nr:hypothetical protein [Pedobacter cryoconitis]MBB5634205.1 energy-coupling factor transporter transmembrane protein EcfT [Pedobacter cryoconitis]
MKIVFYALFVILNCFLIFKLTKIVTPKTAAISYGSAMLIVPLLAFIAAGIVRGIHYIPSPFFLDIFKALLLSFFILILLNLMVLAAGAIVSKLNRFQETHNAVNLERNPVSFARNNLQTIELAYKTIFFALSLLMLYGVWFGEKK